MEENGIAQPLARRMTDMPRLPKTVEKIKLEIKSKPLYRCKLTCCIGKKACENRDIPNGIHKNDWIMYQMFCAIEDLAMHLEGQTK
jgi:hypothetical protein